MPSTCVRRPAGPSRRRRRCWQSFGRRAATSQWSASARCRAHLAHLTLVARAGVHKGEPPEDQVDPQAAEAEDLAEEEAAEAPLVAAEAVTQAHHRRSACSLRDHLHQPAVTAMLSAMERLDRDHPCLSACGVAVSTLPRSVRTAVAVAASRTESVPSAVSSACCRTAHAARRSQTTR